MSLDQLSKLVEDGEKEDSEALARELLAGGTDPLEILDKLTQTMQRVGDLFANLDIFLPEVMLAGEALTAVVDIVKPELKTLDRVLAKGKVVIGVVKGDLHEIGKNIVKLMLETNGFEVNDLGYDV
ncbi:MAG: B12-binding domain-containing protein, partial [Desulfobacterales bacterium]